MLELSPAPSKGNCFDPDIEDDDGNRIYPYHMAARQYLPYMQPHHYYIAWNTLVAIPVNGSVIFTNLLFKEL